MELTELEKYIKRVWNLLQGMKPGDVLAIEKLCKPETRELFIETAKWYMRLHNSTYQDGLSFTKGFMAVQKYDVSFLMKKKKTLNIDVPGEEAPSPAKAGSPPEGGENPPALAGASIENINNVTV